MFANRRTLLHHFRTHGLAMGFPTPEDYVNGAIALMDAAEGVERFVRGDGATLYYRSATNEFAILSATGVLLTYFCPKGRMQYWREETRDG